MRQVVSKTKNVGGSFEALSQGPNLNISGQVHANDRFRYFLDYIRYIITKSYLQIVSIIKNYSEPTEEHPVFDTADPVDSEPIETVDTRTQRSIYQCSCGWEGTEFWSQNPSGVPIRYIFIKNVGYKYLSHE